MKIILLIFTFMLLQPVFYVGFADQKEVDRWEEVRKADNVKIYRQFIYDFPLSPYSDVIRKRLKTLIQNQQSAKILDEWNEISSETDADVFEDFIKKYPYSPVADAARFKLNILAPPPEKKESESESLVAFSIMQKFKAPYNFETGLLLGLHFFENPDQVHGAYSHDETDEGAFALYEIAYQFFMNSYFVDDFGLGFRLHSSVFDRDVKTIIYNGQSQEEATENMVIEISSYFLTLNWMKPIDHTTNWGGYLGAGQYEFRVGGEKLDGDQRASDMAILTGLFMDFGGDVFGWRVEANYTFAEKAKIEASPLDNNSIYQTVDPSGLSLMAGMRAGF